MSDVVVFDVNETLLDTHALDPYFQGVFNQPGMREQWFAQLEVLWMTTIATGTYRGFDVLAEAALEMVARKEGVDASGIERGALMARMTTLPAHPDVAPGLARLRDAGLRLVALSNGTPTGLRTQLAHADLEEYFDEIVSVGEVERFKPAPEPYRLVIERVGVEPGRICMAAAHAWDIAGAHAAGLQTAFVARPRKVLNPAGPVPDLHVADIGELAEQIIRRRGH